MQENDLTDSTMPVLALRPAAAAKALGISPRTLDSLVAEGVIPSVMLSPRVRVFPVHTLTRWLDERATVPVAVAEDDA